MGVYVDKERLHFGRMVMGHMIADTPSELHAMAKKIGLKRRWFQGKASFPHYDVSLTRRALAIDLGARNCNRREFVTHLRRIRGGAENNGWLEVIRSERGITLPTTPKE